MFRMILPKKCLNSKWAKHKLLDKNNQTVHSFFNRRYNFFLSADAWLMLHKNLHEKVQKGESKPQKKNISAGRNMCLLTFTSIFFRELRTQDVKAIDLNFHFLCPEPVLDFSDYFFMDQSEFDSAAVVGD